MWLAVVKLLELPKGLLKIGIVCDLVDQGWDQRFCSSGKFIGDAHASLGTTLSELYSDHLNLEDM